MVFPNQLLISYVEGLDLAIWNGGTLAVNGQDEAAVAGSSAIGFPEGLSQELKEDILDSTLFAQLVANHRHNHVTESGQWYSVYKDTLQNIGWSVQTFEFAETKNASMYLGVEKLLLTLAGAYLTAAELGIFKAILDALSKVMNETPLKIFNKSSMSNNKANFQIGIAGRSGGKAALKMAGYTYGIEGKIVDVLFTRFNNQAAQFSHGNQTMVLNDGVYSTVREKIKDKLREKAQDQLAAISL